LLSLRGAQRRGNLLSAGENRQPSASSKQVTWRVYYLRVSRIGAITPKLDRAKKHIRDFERIAGIFLEDPYVIGTKDKPEIAHIAFFIAAERTLFPADLPLIVGDAIHNLRCTLDHLVWQLVLAHGENPNEATSFPIFKMNIKTGQKETARSLARKTRGVHPEAAQDLELLQPYNTCDYALWHLHQLDIMDKHQLPLRTATYPDVWGLRRENVWLSSEGASLVWDVKVGDELWRFPASTVAHQEDNIKFRFDVAFGDPTVVAGKSVLSVLNGLANLVEEIVFKFERWLY
jgi:hypothetical protein